VTALCLRLYIVGRSGASMRAIANLENLLRQVPASAYQLDIVDVLEHPDLAEQDRILATPTLVRLQPRPVRKLVGDLRDHESAVLALDLDQFRATEPQQD